MKNKKLVYYLVFFALLLIGFWTALYFFTDTFNQTRLPKRAFVQPFNFLKEDGSRFTNEDVKGKVYVANYFFTTCKDVCPRMNGKLKDVYEAFKNEPDFMIVSHTCMPQTDSVPLLKHYADSIMQVNTKHWVFLTGRKDSLYKMARLSYGIDDPKNMVNDIKDDFMHTQFIALVDKNGVVRGQVYDGLKATEIEKLILDIKDLLKEKTLGKNFTNGMFN